MPAFTCSTCGKGFDLPESVRDKYQGWTPKECWSCKKTGAPPESVRQSLEEDLTLEQVLVKYSDGPTDGVFTDGAADPNPGPGGWGAVYVVAGERVAEDWGGKEHTTNNEMELTALLAGCRLVPEGVAAVVYSDSSYAVKAITEWAEGWERRGWKRKTGPLKNLQLIQELYYLVRSRPELELRWIKGHAGSRWNEYADSLATAYRRANL